MEKGFWYRLVHLNPALFRAFIVALFALLASLGIVVNASIPDSLITVVLAVAALIQALWTKAGVTPNDKVLVYVPDPVEMPNTVAPGPATTGASDQKILAAAASEGQGLRYG